jgi:NAD(P)-dependent dehydrogenase (short-subunit alcohol dehydrogenase family)
MQPAGVQHLFAGAPPEALKAFAADRAAMRGGMRLPTTVDAKVQLLSYLRWLGSELADGRAFLRGDVACIADFSTAQSIWYIRRVPPVAEVLAPFPAVVAWFDRVAAHGHGTHEPMTSADAIGVARAATSTQLLAFDEGQGYARGTEVTVTPMDYALDPVPGRLVGLTDDEVAIERDDERAGRVVVHFRASAIRSGRTPNEDIQGPDRGHHRRRLGLRPRDLAPRGRARHERRDGRRAAGRPGAGCAEIESLGAQVLPFRLDVAKAAEVDAMGAATLARFGAPHFVFNNAGVSCGGLIWEHSVKDWEWIVGVNLMGVAHGIRVFTPMMLEAARQDPGYEGHITNTASMAGLVNMPNSGSYNATKSAVVAMSETLYQDLALVTDQIHCSVMCPYFVPTGIIRASATARRARARQAAHAVAAVAKALGEKAVSSGKVSAAQVAQFVLDAVAERRFYVYSHPHALGRCRRGMEDIVQGRNPSDPSRSGPTGREPAQGLARRVAPLARRGRRAPGREGRGMGFPHPGAFVLRRLATALTRMHATGTRVYGRMKRNLLGDPLAALPCVPGAAVDPGQPAPEVKLHRLLAEAPASFTIAFDTHGDSAKRFGVKVVPTSALIGGALDAEIQQPSDQRGPPRSL